MELTSWQWLAVAVLGAIVIFRLGMWFGRGAAEAERIQPISPTRISPEARALIDDALRRGERIEAVKIVREHAGCGLAEAKKTIDAMLPPGS
jgi:hypothetical protein